jgi:4'-phosphopantetheinyl transferase
MTAPAAWGAAPATLALAGAQVHVWSIRLVQPPDVVAALGATLVPDEQTRAARFYFERDRRSFTVVRGALRTLLGRYLGRPPGTLELGYGAKGKPFLAAPAGDSLEFNVSHSGEFALLAFTRGRAIGVDVELRRTLDDLLALADTSFSPFENAMLRALPAERHTEAFFACWSRKEAFIKATGEGISQLAEFDVNLAPGEPARLLRVRGAAAAGTWSMHELPALPGHAAALVVADRTAEIACFTWPPA